MQEQPQYGQLIELPQLPRVVELAMGIGSPLLIVSEPGLGKTETVRRMGYPFIHLSGGTAEVEDVKGLLYNADGVIKQHVPEWYQRAVDATEPTICFIDELSAANHSVRNALLTLLDGSRQIPGLPRVSDCVAFVAAMNPPETNFNCVDLAPAVLNRFIIVSLENSFQTYSRLISTGYDMSPRKLEQNPTSLTREKVEQIMATLRRDWLKVSAQQITNPRTVAKLLKTIELYGFQAATNFSEAILGVRVNLSSLKEAPNFEAAVEFAIKTGDGSGLNRIDNLEAEWEALPEQTKKSLLEALSAANGELTTINKQIIDKLTKGE